MRSWLLLRRMEAASSQPAHPAANPSLLDPRTTGIFTSFSPLASSAAPFPQANDKRGCKTRCLHLDVLPMFLPASVMDLQVTDEG